MRSTSWQVVLAAAVTAIGAPAIACDFEHGDAGGARGQHSDLIGLTGENIIDPTVNFASNLNMQFLSQTTLTQMGGGEGASLWGWTDPLTNREYAIMGRSTGTSFIDVTNPTTPKIVGTLAPTSAGATSSWREPKVVGNYAYIGVDAVNHPIQAVDLTQLRNYSGTTMTLTAAGTFTGVQRAHTLAINSMGGVAQTSADGQKYVFVGGGTEQSVRRGIRALNVTNPAAPFLAGSFQADGYTHEMQVVNYNGPDAAYVGREVAFAFNEDTLTVVDVTNKSAMTQVSRKVQPNFGYVHQGWLTADQKYLISNDETDEANGQTGGQMRTHFWDVQDLDNPVYKGYYNHPIGTIDHNLYVVGNYVIQSDYTAGVRMFKLGDLTDPNPQNWMSLIASYDTYTLNDSASYNGTWNNYPFFKSGNIAISDINGGLIMVRPLVRGYQDYWRSQALGSGIGSGVSETVPEPGALSVLAAAAIFVSRRRR